MREVFEHAYEGISNLLVNITDFALSIVKCVFVVLVYLTIPIWVIPYAVYKEMKGGE